MSNPEMPQSPDQAPVQQPAAPAAPAYQAPAAPAYPVSGPAAPAASNGLSVAALILAIFIAPVGLILGIVALVKSKKAGQKNGLALAAVIIGAVLTVIEIIIAIVVVMSIIAAAALVAGSGTEIMDAAQACVDGATSVEVMGQTLSCEEILSQQ